MAALPRPHRRVNVRLFSTPLSPSDARGAEGRADTAAPRAHRAWLSLMLVALLSAAVNTALFTHNQLTRLALPPHATVPSSSVLACVSHLASSLGMSALRLQRDPLLEQLRTPPRARRMRTFHVQRSRADYRVTVTDALHRLGLQQVNASSDYDVFWGNQWAEHVAYFDRRLHAGMLISSIPGLMAETIGDKDFLGFALQHCVAQHGEDECDFVPPIYTMPMQSALWRAAFTRHRYWIRKDKKIWGSQGVTIINSKKSLPSDASYQLQKYVSHPLLWRGYKHDIRLWAILTSVTPLRLYLLQDGWARVAARAYDADGLESNVGDACMHLTANYCPELPHESLRLLRSNSFVYRSGLATPRSFEHELWPGIEQAVLKTVLLAWPLLSGYDEMLRSNGVRYRRFAFLSFDVLLSHTGQSYVEEVNTNGFLMGTRIPHGWQYTLDAMRLLGIGGYQERENYQTRLEEALYQLCKDENCTARDVEALASLIDETEHAGQFARLFPSSSTEEFAQHRRLGEQAISRVDILSHALAATYFGTGVEAKLKRELIQTQTEDEEDSRRWDWFGSEGNWRQEKEAVRRENRELMHTIRSARNYLNSE